VTQQAPANTHFVLWHANRQHEEEQCLVRKLQQALQTSELRRTASEAEDAAGSRPSISSRPSNEADAASAAVDDSNGTPRTVPPPPTSPELQPVPEVQLSAAPEPEAEP